jgi:hypothetical protein
MAYRIAGIDVHKKMVAVVIADVDVAGTWRFERRQLGTSPTQLRGLADWLVEREVVEVVMESTAQYWRRCGRRWSATGNRGCRRPTAGLAPARCISRKHSRTKGPAAGSGIVPMPNGW